LLVLNAKNTNPPTVQKQHNRLMTTFGVTEKDRYAACFKMSYPADYKVDLRGGIMPDSVKRDDNVKIPEGWLHSLVLRNKDDSLEVCASKFSYIDPEKVIERGFKTPKEVVLVDFFRSSPDMQIVGKDKFEIISEMLDEELELRVIFVTKEARFGFYCFQSLQFTSLDKSPLSEKMDEIQLIIDNFTPVFGRDD